MKFARNTGKNASDLISNYSASQLKYAGYTDVFVLAADSLSAEAGGLSLNVDVLIPSVYGFMVGSNNIIDIIVTQVLTFAYNTGVSGYQLKTAGYADSQLISAGYTDSEINRPTAEQMRLDGYSIYDLQEAGYSNFEILRAGYSASDLQGAGFTATELENAGYSVVDLINAGYTWSMLGQTISGEQGGDNTGNSVSMSSDSSIIAVGSFLNSDNGLQSGNVKMYQYVDGSWNQLGQTIFGEPGDRVGSSVSLSSNGTIVAICANNSSNINENAGIVKIFEYVDGSWNQLGQSILGENIGVYAGSSVSLSSNGNSVIISNITRTIDSERHGNIRTFLYANGSWNQYGQSIVQGLGGESVAMSSDGNYIVFGSFETINGQVRAFNYADGSWNQLGETILGENGDLAGCSVSMSSDGTIISVGAYGNNNYAGKVRIFQYVTGSWNQYGQSLYGDKAGDWGGYSTALSSDGQTVCIGHIQNTTVNQQYYDGYVRLFKYYNGVWYQIGSDILSIIHVNNSDGTGSSVALSSDGNTVIIGAENANGTRGYAQVYTLN